MFFSFLSLFYITFNFIHLSISSEEMLRIEEFGIFFREKGKVSRFSNGNNNIFDAYALILSLSLSLYESMSLDILRIVRDRIFIKKKKKKEKIINTR